jgi:hypothetical protein
MRYFLYTRALPAAADQYNATPSAMFAVQYVPVTLPVVLDCRCEQGVGGGVPTGVGGRLCTKEKIRF